MISLDEAVIARLTSHGHTFEIYVEPEKAAELKSGEDISLDDVLAAREVYKDASKAERASEETLKEAFKTTDVGDITRMILRKGDIQLTTEQRHKMQKEKKKLIVNIIARGAVDPRTNAPHPPARIERAIDEARVHIDPFRGAQRQVDEIVTKLRPILPLKFAMARVAVKVAPDYAGKAYGYLHDLKMKKEEWANDGSLLAMVEIPAGMQAEVYDRLNAITHGSVETKLLETF